MPKKSTRYGKGWSLDKAIKRFGEAAVMSFAKASDIRNWKRKKHPTVASHVIVKLYEQSETPIPHELDEALNRVRDHWGTEAWSRLKSALDAVGPPSWKLRKHRRAGGGRRATVIFVDFRTGKIDWRL